MSEQEPHYNLLIHEAAQRELAQVTGQPAESLQERLHALKSKPNPLDARYAKELSNHAKLFRVKVEDYRVLCTLDKPNLLVLVVAPRTRVYDKIQTAKERMNER